MLLRRLLRTHMQAVVALENHCCLQSLLCWSGYPFSIRRRNSLQDPTSNRLLLLLDSPFPKRQTHDNQDFLYNVQHCILYHCSSDCCFGWSRCLMSRLHIRFLQPEIFGYPRRTNLTPSLDISFSFLSSNFIRSGLYHRTSMEIRNTPSYYSTAAQLISCY